MQHLRVIDPVDRIAETYTAAGLLKLSGERVAIAGTPIYVDLRALFAALPKK